MALQEPSVGRSAADPWRAAGEYGIDLDQLEYSLSLTPEQRLARHDQALELVRALRQAGIRHYGFDPRLPEGARPPER